MLMVTGAGTTSLINEQCSPNTVLYAWDTYGISNSLAGSITKAGKKNWYFLTVDYARPGHRKGCDEGDWRGRRHGRGGSQAPDRYFRLLVLCAGRSKLSCRRYRARQRGRRPDQRGQGSSRIWRYPNANPSRPRTSTSMHLASEAAQGMVLVEGFYWDRNDESRAWSQRSCQGAQQNADDAPGRHSFGGHNLPQSQGRRPGPMMPRLFSITCGRWRLTTSSRRLAESGKMAGWYTICICWR